MHSTRVVGSRVVWYQDFFDESPPERQMAPREHFEFLYTLCVCVCVSYMLYHIFFDPHQMLSTSCRSLGLATKSVVTSVDKIHSFPSNFLHPRMNAMKWSRLSFCCSFPSLTHSFGSLGFYRIIHWPPLAFAKFTIFIDFTLESDIYDLSAGIDRSIRLRPPSPSCPSVPAHIVSVALSLCSFFFLSFILIQFLQFINFPEAQQRNGVEIYRL